MHYTKRFLGNILFILSALVFATSCTDYDGGMDENAMLYNKTFLEQFGSIDPNHTWNTVAQRELTFKIGMPGNFNLRIFTTDPRTKGAQSEMLANYQNDGKGYKGATGEDITVKFDCPDGLFSVYADIQYVGTERHIMQRVPLTMQGDGMAVFGNAGGTRGYTDLPTGTYGNATHAVYTTGHKEFFSKEAYVGSGGTDKGFMNVIPEQQNNTSKEHVATDFVYVSTGLPTHLYPIYTWTGANVEVGIQWRAAGTTTWNDFGSDTNKATIWSTRKEGTSDNGSSLTAGRIIRLFDNSDGTHTTAWDNNRFESCGNKPTGSFYYDGGDPSTYFATKYDDPHFVGTMCDEIIINLPVGTEYRFWMKQDLTSEGKGSLTAFSDKKTNIDHKATYDKTGNSNNNGIYFATFENGHKHTINGTQRDVLYLGIEDWNSSIHDLNDIVFAFVDPLPVVLEEGGPFYQEIEYTIAFEDLGSTNDIDFNDVVIGVKHVSGEEKATVSLKACGGTLPVYLHYDDVPQNAVGHDHSTHCQYVFHANADEKFGLELHDVLKSEGGKYVYSTRETSRENGLPMLNTQYGTEATGHVFPTHDINVASDFSMATCAEFFAIFVGEAGKTFSQQNFSDHDALTHRIAPAGSTTTGEAPQAIVISKSNWQWPMERQNIASAYPKFSEWVQNRNNSSWYYPIWSGVDENSSSIDPTQTLIPSKDYTVCIADRAQLLSDPTITLTHDDIVSKGLDSKNSIELAFVLTGREVGETPMVTVTTNYTNSTPTVEHLVFCDHKSTGSSNSFGEIGTIEIPKVNWSDVSNITISFNRDGTGVHPDDAIHGGTDGVTGSGDAENPTHTNSHEAAANSNCHLNSIWAKPNHIRATLLTREAVLNMEVEQTKTVAVVNPSLTKNIFLYRNGTKTHPGTTMEKILETAHEIAEKNLTDGIFTLTKVADGYYTLMVKKDNYYYGKNSGNWNAAWVSPSEANTELFHLKFVAPTVNVNPNNVVADYATSSEFWIYPKADTTTSYRLNGNGLKFATGTGDWTRWMFYELDVKE